MSDTPPAPPPPVRYTPASSMLSTTFNWIKTHQRHTWAILGATLIFLGVVLMLPRDPVTLIVAGGLILFIVFISIVDSSPTGPK